MSGRLRPPGRRCLPALGVVAALLAAAIGPALIPTVAGAAGPSLTRDPYITDATSTNATVDFATNTQSPAPVVTWGPSGGGSPCTGSATPAPAGTAITVNGKAEFQFAAALTGLVPDAGYCYRVTQGGVDLLGTRKSPGFTSARASGAAGAFRFAVIGDWGAGTSSEANVLQHMTTSSPRFVITVGDNAYPSGSETEYGDRSGGHVFAPSYWPVLGGGVPAFLAQGNHGFATYQPLLTDWPQGSTVAACATTGCRYTSAAYPSLDGSRAATYANAWYAFDVGNARFYVLEAAWDDANVGSAGAYKLDYDAHWNPTNGAAEYQWLKADLAAHGSTPLKFAFFHYPLRVDGGAASDTRLQGTSQSTLEGLLAGNSVDIVFNGHAHIYERNLPQVPGSPMVNYVTGGGGDAVGPLKTCSSFDAYALGGAGTSCKAPKPTSDKQVHNFLQVDVNGANVTVTPTDETGRTFDVQSYNFTAALPGNISGTVTGTGGTPVSGATVSYGGGSVATAPDGTYVLNGVVPGTYTVTASATGYLSQSASTTVNSGATTVQDFALTAGHQSVFSDGFESGTLSAWTSGTGLTVQSSIVHGGTHAAEGATTTGQAFAKKLLASTYTDAYERAWVDVRSTSSQANVLRARTASGGSIAYLFVTATGKLGLSNGTTRLVSTTPVSSGTFHALELHVTIAGASSTTEVWLDGVRVDSLSVTINLGTTPVGMLQIGDTATGFTSDIVYDDAAFDTQFIP